MALRGSVKDHGIADVFQLISLQGKSGVLMAQSDGAAVRVSFYKGNVVWAGPSERTRRQHLGSRLVRAAIITEDQLHEALQAQKGSTRRLGEILVENFGVAETDVARAIELQTTEPLYQIFRWRHGDYEFVPDDAMPAPERAPIKVDMVLMEAFRRMDRWKEIDEQIPDRSRQLEATAGVDVEEGAEQAVLSMVDGPTPVQNVVDRALLGELEAFDAILKLLKRGALGWKVTTEIREAQEAQAAMEAAAAAAAAPARRGFRWGWALLVLLTAGLGAAFWYVDPSVVPLPEPVPFETQVAQALDVVKLATGEFPATLDERVLNVLRAELGEDVDPSRLGELSYLRWGDAYLLAPASRSVLFGSQGAP